MSLLGALLPHPFAASLSLREGRIDVLMSYGGQWPLGNGTLPNLLWSGPAVTQDGVEEMEEGKEPTCRLLPGCSLETQRVITANASRPQREGKRGGTRAMEGRAWLITEQMLAAPWGECIQDGRCRLTHPLAFIHRLLGAQLGLV